MDSVLRSHADAIIKASITAVLPDEAVKRALDGQTFPGRVLLVSAGKAAWQMAKAAYDFWGDRIENGVVVTKFTGSRGKAGTSDASAEYVAEIRAMLDKADITWQTGELGRIDLGGGGTVAMYIANQNINTVDLGVPVLSMHAPYEVVSKFDVYSTYRACEEFYKS